MDNLLPLLSIHNSVYAFSFVTFAVCVCYVLNKFVDISPIGSHNDLSLEGLRGVAWGCVSISFR